MEKYLVLATFVGSIIALLFVVITAKKVLRFSEGCALNSSVILLTFYFYIFCLFF